MAKKENAEKPIVEESIVEESMAAGKLKLFNSRTSKLIIIEEDKLGNYDIRLWQVV